MAEQTFETFIEKERDRLAKERQTLMGKQREIADKLTAIQREMDAITAYETTKRGKPATTRATRQSTGRRGQFGARDTVLAEVKKHPGGIKSGDVFDALNLPDTKQARQFVSNALSYYKRNNQLTLANGLYSSAGAPA